MTSPEGAGEGEGEGGARSHVLRLGGGLKRTTEATAGLADAQAARRAAQERPEPPAGGWGAVVRQGRGGPCEARCGTSAPSCAAMSQSWRRKTYRVSREVFSFVFDILIAF